MKYQVGDRVVIRDDLEDHKDYGGTRYVHGIMKTPPSGYFTIREIHSAGDFTTLECTYYNWLFNEEMVKGLYEDLIEHRTFATGAVRDTSEGKPPMEYMPWDLMDRVAIHYGKGGEKYGYNNYRLGQPKKDVYASLMRHARKYFMGDTSEDHLSAIIWNAFSLMHTDVYYPNDEELNNLQDYKKKIREGK